MAKIVIGQYYPAPSLLHRLDARVKLIATFTFVISLFFVDNWFGYGYAALALALAIWLSKVPPLFMLRGLRAMLFILLFTASLNLFFAPGETVLVQFGFVTITQEGLLLASRMALRLIILVVGSTVMTLTTTPIALTDGIERLLSPFKIVRLPVHEIAMMMTIALRFIPTLLEEVDKIIKAQTARGADFDTGGFLKKAKSLVPMLIPLFVSAFRRADELAQAMDARCYRGDIGRTKMNAPKMAARDFAALCAIALYVLGLVLLNMI